jgi:uncharacterized protein (TIGR00299 family) protein
MSALSDIGWLDCSAGASGDMLLGALVDVGVPLELLRRSVSALGVESIDLHRHDVRRHGIGATRIEVRADAAPAHRSWSDVRALLESAALDEPVRRDALAVFGRLARAEGAVHRIDPEWVHFHEVGALDALADVVGVCAGFRALGLPRLACSTVAVGAPGPDGGVPGAAGGVSGHGPVPVPAPAVLALFGEVAAPIRAGAVPHEACTPTGAALLAELVTDWMALPAMRVDRVGHGAGGRDPAEAANLVRLVLGSAIPGPIPSEVGSGVVIETNIDDLDPRLWPEVLRQLQAAGASDAWLTPILMKKGRPAHTLHVLAAADRVDVVRAAVYRHTTTIGTRALTVAKHALTRNQTTVQVDGWPVGVKQAFDDGRLVNASVEYEDVARAAVGLGIPVKLALARAIAAAQRDGMWPESDLVEESQRAGDDPAGP